MSSDNPLDPVYKALSVESDCFKIAAHSIQVQHRESICRTQFMRATREEASAVLQDAATQAADLAGQVKQIKQYRDWIAHQNPNEPTATRTTPETAFDVLTKMIAQIRLTHTSPAKQQAAEAALT